MQEENFIGHSATDGASTELRLSNTRIKHGRQLTTLVFGSSVRPVTKLPNLHRYIRSGINRLKQKVASYKNHQDYQFALICLPRPLSLQLSELALQHLCLSVVLFFH
jgi:hypothetical protein